MNNFEKFTDELSRTYVRTDKNGTDYYDVVCTCAKCRGTGRIECFKHVSDGICFDCYGAGAKHIEHKVYTPEYLEKKRIRDEKKFLKQAAERLESENEKTLKRLGLNEEGVAYVVLGDTYEIRNELKAEGAKFNYFLGWHFLEEPKDRPFVKVSIEQIATKNSLGFWVEGYVANIVDELKAEASKNPDEIPSEYIGEEGDKIEIELMLDKVRGFNSDYGYTYVYIFKAGNDVVVWKTQKGLDLEEGGKVKVKATIKEHSEYDGVKQTYITRAKVLG